MQQNGSQVVITSVVTNGGPGSATAVAISEALNPKIT